MDHDGMSGLCIRSRGGGGGGGSVGGGGGGSGGSKCGRWNPTAEQVKVLTDLFRAGLRTPSTEQIQKISCQLSFYGKIESKNVFYWFQNHKARERQKRRRVTTVLGSVAAPPPPPPPPPHQSHIIDHNNHKYSNSSTRLMDSKDHDEAGVVVEERSVMRETLQLFPLNSMIMSQPDHDHKFMIRKRYNHTLADQIQINTSSSTSAASFGPHHDHYYIMDHPPLDLRLSFM